jgi:hypothetical protein
MEELDAAGVATLTYDQRQTYDGEGRLSQRVIDFDGVGELPARTTDFVYDAETGLLAETRSGTSVTKAFYNERGEHIRSEADSNADGTPETIVTVVNNGLGQPLFESLDRDADGTIDQVTSYLYESRGYRVASYDDEGNDGKMEFTSETSYSVDRILFDRFEFAAEGDVPGFAAKTTYRYDCEAAKTPAVAQRISWTARILAAE